MFCYLLCLYHTLLIIESFGNESKNSKNPYHKTQVACHMLFPLITRCPFYHSFSKTQHFEIESEKFQKSLSQTPSCLSHAIPAYHSLSLLSLIFVRKEFFATCFYFFAYRLKFESQFSLITFFRTKDFEPLVACLHASPAYHSLSLLSLIFVRKRIFCYLFLITQV